MFHILSKTVEIFTSPFIWILIVLALRWVVKAKRWKQRLKVFAIVLLLVFTNPLLNRWAMQSWEKNLLKTEVAANRAETVVVLGGMAAFHEQSGRVRFNGASDRLWQAVSLYKKGYVSRIFIAGGSSKIILNEKPESEFVRDFLLLLGIPEKDIFIENRSRNTFQNAKFTGDFFSESGWEKNIVLVTSAFHVPRAKACFEKQGFDVFAFGADPLKSVRKVTLREVFVPSLEPMEKWSLLFKEWFGILVYKVRGYL